MVKRIVTCKITDIKENPKGGQNIFIECSIGQRKWIIERYVNYKTPISMEKFIRDLKKTSVIPQKPKDVLAYVKEEADKPFTITIDDKN